jgi:hypothetical protein
MNRRDFLLLRRERASRIAEISACRLYMRSVDAQFMATQPEEVSGTPGDTWEGEPPQVFDRQTVEELFERFSRDLEGVDVLRITEPGWLELEPVRGHIDRLLTAFQSRGGRVELISGNAASAER